MPAIRPAIPVARKPLDPSSPVEECCAYFFSPVFAYIFHFPISFQLPPRRAGLVIKRGADRAATAALAVMRPDLTDQARFLILPVAPDYRRRSGDQLIAARATGSLAAKYRIPPSVACMFCGHFPSSFQLPPRRAGLWLDQAVVRFHFAVSRALATSASACNRHRSSRLMSFAFQPSCPLPVYVPPALR